MINDPRGFLAIIPRQEMLFNVIDETTSKSFIFDLVFRLQHWIAWKFCYGFISRKIMVGHGLKWRTALQYLARPRQQNILRSRPSQITTNTESPLPPKPQQLYFPIQQCFADLLKSPVSSSRAHSHPRAAHASHPSSRLRPHHHFPKPSKRRSNSFKSPRQEHSVHRNLNQRLHLLPQRRQNHR